VLSDLFVRLADLDARGIQIVTVCADTAGQVRAGRFRALH